MNLGRVRIPEIKYQKINNKGQGIVMLIYLQLKIRLTAILDCIEAQNTCLLCITAYQK